MGAAFHIHYSSCTPWSDVTVWNAFRTRWWMKLLKKPLVSWFISQKARGFLVELWQRKKISIQNAHNNDMWCIIILTRLPMRRWSKWKNWYFAVIVTRKLMLYQWLETLNCRIKYFVGAIPPMIKSCIPCGAKKWFTIRIDPEQAIEITPVRNLAGFLFLKEQIVAFFYEWL